jgi:hypothetical protein
MTQTLYAHMNNKTIFKNLKNKKKKDGGVTLIINEAQFRENSIVRDKNITL